MGQSPQFSDPVLAILESALLAMGPLSIERMETLFEEEERPSREKLQATIRTLAEACSGRALELVEVANGWRYQVRREWAPWLGREGHSARYSRALLETLALIAYRQPITRAQIEGIRGVTASSSVFKILLEKEWVRVVGHQATPGRPALYGTTKQFLDHFNLASVANLPKLPENHPAGEE
ncbi:segregation and condensation protein B [Gammaproteobacteria bacterium]